MDHTIPFKVVGDERERPVDDTLEKLQEENAQLRDLVIQLTTIVVRKVLERKPDISH